MNSIKRGDVFYANFNGEVNGSSSLHKKNRPWVVISCDVINKHSPVIQVAPLTASGKERTYASQAKVFCRGRSSLCCLEQARAVDVDTEWVVIDTLSAWDMKGVDQAIQNTFFLQGVTS